MQQERNLLLLFFLSVFFGALLWLAAVPLFHTPDEQAHIAQVAYIAQTGQNPLGNAPDLTEELYTAEQLLGTDRDSVGNNRFTFHPEYKIDYSETTNGPYETAIATMAGTSVQRTFAKQEASRYPILYYLPGSWIYSLLLNQDLFVRVFFLRLWSLVLFLLTVAVSYLIGMIVFPKNRLMALTTAIMVGFQPMMIFSNIGVNSDALGNLLFTLFIYLLLRLLTGTINGVNAGLLLAVSVLCWYTKPQFLIVVPILIVLILILMLRTGKKSAYLWVLGAVGAGSMLFFAFIYFRIGLFRLAGPIWSAFDAASFTKFTKEYTLTHTVSEVLPWYWGIYKWLGVTYPRWVHRIINRVLAIAAVGIGFWVIARLRKKQWKSQEFLTFLFISIICGVFFAFLALYDWYLWYTSSFVLGVQGRYYFPLISVTMVVILMGIRTILPRWKHLDQWGIKFLGIGMVLLNGYGLWTVIQAYYDTGSVNTVMLQASQYKPWFLKGLFLVSIVVCYVLTSVLFLFSYIRKRA